MEFVNDVQKALYEKITAWMRECFGEFVRLADDAPRGGIQLGSTVAEYTVIPWRDDEALCCVRSYVVMGAELTPELLRFLLEANDRVVTGAFAIDDDGDIAFTAAIPGSLCSKEACRRALMAVASTADEYDDQIVARWGGQSCLDRMRAAD